MTQQQLSRLLLCTLFPSDKKQQNQLEIECRFDIYQKSTVWRDTKSFSSYSGLYMYMYVSIILGMYIQLCVQLQMHNMKVRCRWNESKLM